MYAVSVSPDRRTLATGGRGNTVRLWDLSFRELLGEPLTGHTQSVWSLAFSPDGRALASASGDGTVRLWALPLVAGHSSGMWAMVRRRIQSGWQDRGLRRQGQHRAPVGCRDASAAW